MSRDPRRDPQPGDVLQLSGWARMVAFSAKPGRVVYGTRCGHQWLNGAMHCDLYEWRTWAADAEVQRTAGEE